jgi:uncharacterized protein
MQKFVLIPALASLFCVAGMAQARRNIQAVGTGTASGQPDQVKVTIGVTTTGSTAQEAASLNATQMTAVQNAIRQVLGPGADIKTIGYSVTPNYKQNQNGPPMLVGYTATNTIDVTGSDLISMVKVIDSVGAAGATNITNLRFTISNDAPLREQALTAATKQAMAHAQAIATGLGAHVGAVVAAQEGFTVTPLAGNLAPAATPTPIEPGQVQVSATVTIAVEIAP